MRPPPSLPLLAATRRRLRGRPAAAAAVALACIAAASCGGSSSPSEPARPEAVFRVLSSAESGETFHVVLRDPRRIAEAESLVGQGNRKIVNGRLARGDGGFNQPWSWHMVPGTVELPDTAIELCDGHPSDVEADLDYWIDTVGRFCPWGSEIVARVR